MDALSKVLPKRHTVRLRSYLCLICFNCELNCDMFTDTKHFNDSKQSFLRSLVHCSKNIQLSSEENKVKDVMKSLVIIVVLAYMQLNNS